MSSKVLMFFVVGTTLLLTSCNKIEDQIVGEWTVEEAVLGVTNIVTDSTTTFDVTNAYESYTFKNDKTFTLIRSEVELDDNGNVVIHETPQTINGNWVAHVDNLSTIVDDISRGSYTIENIDKNHLSLSRGELRNLEDSLSVSFHFELVR